MKSKTTTAAQPILIVVRPLRSYRRTRVRGLDPHTRPAWLWGSLRICGKPGLARAACPSPLGMSSHGTARHAGRPSSLMAMWIAEPSSRAAPDGWLSLHQSWNAWRRLVRKRVRASFPCIAPMYWSARTHASRTTPVATTNCEYCLRDTTWSFRVLPLTMMVLVHAT